RRRAPRPQWLRRRRRARGRAGEGRARVQPGSRRLRPAPPAQPGCRLHQQGPAVGKQGAGAAREMRLLFPIVGPTGIALAVLAYEIQVSSLDSSDSRAVAHVAIGLSFLLAGLIAWSRRPANRLGSLMVAAGFALLLRQLRYSNDSMAFTVF